MRSNGAAAGEVESIVRFTYSPDAPPEQPNEQYERKFLPMMVELVLFALSRNHRYHEAVV